jgi:UDP-GlcNAc:undecaprenyl-phosphate GlcNAc-1-phosphate transferase
MMAFGVTFGVGLVTSAAASLLLARLAPRMGWTDAPAGAHAQRKLQDRPVPAIGGAAILLGLLAAALVGEGAPALFAVPASFPAPWPGLLPMLASLLAAFGVGLADDLVPGGLAARTKLAAQALVAAPLAASVLLQGWHGDPLLALGWAALWVGAAVCAMNAFNTFDNADGALCSVGILGFAVSAPLLCAPLLGFLPFNLDRRSSRRAPTAYLGDSGSHLLGLLVLLTPGAWPVLLLPLFDLARLSVLRWRLGAPPWRGDRRHLAHRLAAAGMGRVAVVLTLLALASPSLLGRLLPEGALWPGLGAGATGLLFLLAVARTPDPQETPGTRGGV